MICVIVLQGCLEDCKAETWFLTCIAKQCGGKGHAGSCYQVYGMNFDLILLSKCLCVLSLMCMTAVLHL